MANPGLSHEIATEALEAVRRYGGQAPAARALGIPRGTLISRLHIAREMGAKLPEREVLPPILPDGDEPLDSLIERMEAEHARKKARQKAEEWMTFTVSGAEPFAVVFVGDPHIDTCDIATLRRHLDVIENTPRMWAVGMGDWINGWVGKLRAEYAHQTVTERQAYQLARWMLQRPIWLLCLLGNHDGQRWHGQGSPLRWMETASMVPPVDWQAKFTLSCGAASWRVWAAHNFPGHSMHNPGHGPMRRAKESGGVADLFIAGDKHTPFLTRAPLEHVGKSVWSGRARGYKDLDMYALEHGHSGTDYGHSIAAVCDPRTGKMMCFDDLDDAAAYLTFLRLRRLG